MRERRDDPSSDSEAEEDAEECEDSGDVLGLRCDIEAGSGRGDRVCDSDVVSTILCLVTAPDLDKDLEVAGRLYLHVIACFRGVEV